MFKKNLRKGRRTIIGILLGVMLITLLSQAVMAGPCICYYRHWISFHSGITITSEDMVKSVYWNWIIDFRLYCWCRWILLIELGYNNFQWDIPEGMLTDKTFHWWNINPSLRYYLGEGNIKPYLTFGPGVYLYKYENANLTRFGGKIGLGFDYNLSDRVMFEMGGDFHHVFLKAEDSLAWKKAFSFPHVHAGFVINFGRARD